MSAVLQLIHLSYIIVARGKINVKFVTIHITLTN
jgi:hypothetical protein